LRDFVSADGEKFKFSEENPFVDEEEDDEEEKGFPVASVGYRYRKWDLGNDVILLARCEHDAVVQVSEEGSAFLYGIFTQSDRY
jgi:translation initiation factor 3 subunit D